MIRLAPFPSSGNGDVEKGLEARSNRNHLSGFSHFGKEFDKVLFVEVNSFLKGRIKSGSVSAMSFRCLTASGGTMHTILGNSSLLILAFFQGLAVSY